MPRHMVNATYLVSCEYSLEIKLLIQNAEYSFIDFLKLFVLMVLSDHLEPN